MKKILLYQFLTILVLFSSCSGNDEDNPLDFQFLEFERDVLLPSINDRTLTFLAYDFDPKINNWEVSLSGEGNTFPVSISNIEYTTSGHVNLENSIQRVSLIVPPLENGTYTVTIKNKKTSQIYTDQFLIRSKLFSDITYDHAARYNIISSYTEGEEYIHDYFYFHNIENTINDYINPNGITGIRFEDKNSTDYYDIDFTLDNNDKVKFTIPNAVPPGQYYLSIRYNHLINSYFTKDIIVLEEKRPVITEVNKNEFIGGERLIINGSNFRYQIQSDFHPLSGIRNVTPPSKIMVVSSNENGGSGTGYVHYSPYEDDPTYNLINQSNTEMIFDIPTNKTADDLFYTSDVEGTYLEAEFYIMCGPYINETPIAIRIDYEK